MLQSGINHYQQQAGMQQFTLQPQQLPQMAQMPQMAQIPQMAQAHMPNGYMPAYTNPGANVRVSELKPIQLGQINSFVLDASQAGKGTLDLSVGPPGKTLKHQVKGLGNQIFGVEFVPEDAVNHEVSIQFDDYHVPGSPFQLQAPFIDASNIIVSGEGLVVAKVNQASEFNINAARLPGSVQPSVSITGPDGTQIQPNIYNTDRGNYKVTWSPHLAGDHEVRVHVAGREVPRSPFKVRVSDHNQVLVDCPPTAKIGQNTDVKVDVSRAGIGRLVVIISVDGVNVPNAVHQDGPSKYRFSFKPTIAKNHDVTVQFNGQDVRGSPYSCMVAGGPQNVYLNDKQMLHHFGQPVEIEIDARAAGEGQIVAEVRSESGGVPSDLTPTSTRKVYNLMFTPKEGGEHFITVTFNDESVPNSPLRIHVQGGPRANQNVVSETHRNDQQYNTEAFYRQNNIHQMSPAPSPSLSYHEQITTQTSHNEQNGPQSLKSIPYDQYDTIQKKEIVRTITYQPQFETAQVDEQTYFEINAHGLSSKDLNVKLEDPTGRECLVDVKRYGDKLRYSFTPADSGKYQVYIDVDGTVLPGSPFTYYVQPSSVVKITDVTPEGEVGEDMYFIVDTSKAGRGDLDVEVACNGGIVKTRKEPLGNGVFRYAYTPKQAGRHEIDVEFNYQSVPDCPIYTEVSDSRHRSLDRHSSPLYGVQTAGYETMTRVDRVSGRGIQSIPVSQQAYFIIDMHGKNWKLTDVEVEVRGGFPLQWSPSGSVKGRGEGEGSEKTEDSVFMSEAKAAPNGELVMAKLYQESPSEIRVEYETPYVGRHLVDIWCKGQKVVGSPYTVQVFDPKKVGLESMAKETYLHEQTEFEVRNDNEVVNEDAGSADMECKVISPNGRIIPSHVVQTDRGMKVKYTPQEPGVYYVHTYIGGVEIPGSPMTQVVRAHTLRSTHGGGSKKSYREHTRREEYDDTDSYGKITVSGDGLYRGEENQTAVFYIDTHGMEGMPEVRVEGPHSVAKCNIVQESPYRYKVSYIPVETGVYNVTVRWFGQEIEGSPFHPRIVCARKVKAHGDWSTNLDKQQRIQLTVGEMKRLMFDVSEAGPGDLRAEVRHVASGRVVPVTISEKDAFHYYVDFVPDQEGDYLVSINWTDTPIPNSPLRGFATSGQTHQVKMAAEAKQQSAAGGKSGKEFSSTTTKTVTKSGGKSVSGAHSKQMTVVLSGTGLKEGILGQMAEFFIDGSKATDGIPKVELKNSRLQQIAVHMTSMGNKTYRCTYLPEELGAHMLFVSWAGLDLKNSPYTVMIKDAGDMMMSGAAGAASAAGAQKSSQQSSSFSQHQSSNYQSAEKDHSHMNGSSLQAGQGQGHGGQVLSQQASGQQGGMNKQFSQHVRRAKMTTSANSQGQAIGENMQLRIDAATLAAGDLYAKCQGPTKSAKCELVQQEQGYFALNVKPTEAGEHRLDVTYNGEHIDGSPFSFKVNGPPPPDPSKVRVTGPGIEHGIIANFESRFFVDTEGAGPGNLSVKMRGPKGGFHASMKRLTRESRTIECTYNPEEVGLYVIHIKWSGVDVPGSPFNVHIFDTYYEMDRFRTGGELPSELREQHILRVQQPQASYQTSAYQTNTLKTLKKSKKSKKAAKNGGVVILPAAQPVPIQHIEQPVQYVVREPSPPPVQYVQEPPVQYITEKKQYTGSIREPVFVPQQRDVRDANYIVAGPGREIPNGGGQQVYRSSYQYNSQGGRTADYGTLGRSGGGTYRTQYVAQDPGPLYATVNRRQNPHLL